MSEVWFTCDMEGIKESSTLIFVNLLICCSQGDAINTVIFSKIHSNMKNIKFKLQKALVLQ